MPTITLDIDRNSNHQLDVLAIFELIENEFSSAKLLSSDALLDRANNARVLLEKMDFDEKDKSKILRTLERNAKQYGPAYSFQISDESGIVNGVLRPIDITFMAESTISPELWERLVKFVQQFDIGKVSTFD
ncbi:hypothetical protein [Gimesia aquarii]|uniref:Uncharacterized protein n=1 Tax=Gimesia aquarii TaxID=2527964 RepID=A0A517WUZ5_9PLAN|nr:hypothetical protein [Gimesia aquarii]QDU09052.1 hypothetical protein V202x_24230 [Gimesia aquarii]